MEHEREPSSDPVGNQGASASKVCTVESPIPPEPRSRTADFPVGPICRSGSRVRRVSRATVGQTFLFAGGARVPASRFPLQNIQQPTSIGFRRCIHWLLDVPLTAPAGRAPSRAGPGCRLENRRYVPPTFQSAWCCRLENRAGSTIKVRCSNFDRAFLQRTQDGKRMRAGESGRFLGIRLPPFACQHPAVHGQRSLPTQIQHPLGFRLFTFSLPHPSSRFVVPCRILSCFVWICRVLSGVFSAHATDIHSRTTDHETSSLP